MCLDEMGMGMGGGRDIWNFWSLAGTNDVMRNKFFMALFLFIFAVHSNF